MFTLNQFSYILSSPVIKPYISLISTCLLYQHNFLFEEHFPSPSPTEVITSLSHFAILLLQDEQPHYLAGVQDIEKLRNTFQGIFEKTYQLASDNNAQNEQFSGKFGNKVAVLIRTKILNIGMFNINDLNIAYRLALILKIAMLSSHHIEYLKKDKVNAIINHPNPKQLLEDFSYTLNLHKFLERVSDNHEIRKRASTLALLRVEKTSLFHFPPPDVIRIIASNSTYGTLTESEMKPIVESNIQPETIAAPSNPTVEARSNDQPKTQANGELNIQEAITIQTNPAAESNAHSHSTRQSRMASQ